MFGASSVFLFLNLGVFLSAVTVLAGGEKFKEDERIFTNGWAIKVHGGLEEAKRIAKAHGFEKIEPIGTLDGYYHLEHPSHPQRSRRSAEDRTDRLLETPGVSWTEQQHEKVRVKRGHFHDRMVARGIIPRFQDPLWDAQWYLDDKRKDQDLDIHVIPVWNQGITGKGVVVTILDDGIEHNHTDLIRNYDPNASWDVNGRDSDPFPRYDPTNENKHGTRCAGEVASQANNTKCGVGVAYNARIGGVRMLDGRVTDKVEAESLSLNPQYIDIYSASWGPSDDGATVEGPGTLAMAAFLNGIQKGRAGLGSIFIWASGNGGRHGDSCNCDGYTDSIYTLSISSASDHGESPWYSESCSSTLATTFSSGAHGEKRIVTTDLHDTCTEKHTGTSASAPLAAGIVALALEKNPKLTWRDVQHIVVWTSNWLPLKHDQDWSTNGVGLKVNRKFGYGLLVAEKIVNMANPETFKSVPEKRLCRGQIHQDAKPIKSDQNLTVALQASGCSGTKDEVRYLEHVQLLVSLDYTRRGDLVIYLTSPMGTKSCLLSPRKEDMSNEGFSKWPFMTTHSWGEDPRGVWTLEIKDLGDSKVSHGTLREWQLIFHGTRDKPGHQKIEHPDKPRDPAPVPPSPHLGYSSSGVPSGPTYVFGPQPQPKNPNSYTTYTSISPASYPAVPPPTKPPTPPTTKPPNKPKAIIPYPPAAIQSRPPTHLVVAQVQQVNPQIQAQIQARLQAQKIAQAEAQARNYLAQKNALQQINPLPLRPIYGPERPPPPYVPRPPSYLAPNYYGRYQYGPNERPNPNLPPSPFLRASPVGWHNAPVYQSPLFRLHTYNYLRTLGRRGVKAKAFQRPKHNRLSKLRKKWREKSHT